MLDSESYTLRIKGLGLGSLMVYDEERGDRCPYVKVDLVHASVQNSMEGHRRECKLACSLITLHSYMSPSTSPHHSILIRTASRY